MNRQYSDLIIVAFVMCVIALLVVPLPTGMIDMLIAFNIAVSLLLLLIGLSLKNTLTLLTFPAILLLSTLFRLSLNVASTRLILSQGDAGEIIRSFGTFLIRGEVAVGVIIFLIITVVNFIVIAKGAGRISEVAARFTLDALPGKQMAIDSELRTGSISAEQAKEKREDLRKETQLYGSMDGAMKFVQGDVIAGIFIIFTNIFGGIYLGVRQGLSFADALGTYTTLTIGDGLVTQVPALLVSICAGVVVTRVSSDKNSTLGSDLILQLFQNRKVLLLSAFATLMVAFLPNVPALPFVLIAAAFAAVAYFSNAKITGSAATKRRVRQISNDERSGSQSIAIDYAAGDLSIILAKNLYQQYLANEQEHISRWYEVQDDFQNRCSLQLPNLKVVQDTNYTANEFSLRHKDFEFTNSQQSANLVYIYCQPEQLRAFDLEVSQEAYHPLTNRRGALVKRDEKLDLLIRNCNLKHEDSIQMIFARAEKFYMQNPEELIQLTQVHQEIKEIENRYPGLFADLFVNQFLTPSRIVTILKHLGKSGFFFHDLRTLLETLALYTSSDGKELVKTGEFVVEDIVSFIRRHKKRETISPYLTKRQVLRVVTLAEQLKERCIMLNLRDQKERKQLVSSIQSVYNGYVTKSTEPVVLLVPDGLRTKLEGILSSLSQKVPVISYAELDSAVSIEPLGEVSV